MRPFIILLLLATSAAAADKLVKLPAGCKDLVEITWKPGKLRHVDPETKAEYDLHAYTLVGWYHGDDSVGELWPENPEEVLADKDVSRAMVHAGRVLSFRILDGTADKARTIRLRGRIRELRREMALCEELISNKQDPDFARDRLRSLQFAVDEAQAEIDELAAKKPKKDKEDNGKPGNKDKVKD